MRGESGTCDTHCEFLGLGHAEKMIAKGIDFYLAQIHGNTKWIRGKVGCI